MRQLGLNRVAGSVETILMNVVLRLAKLFGNLRRDHRLAPAIAAWLVVLFPLMWLPSASSKGDLLFGVALLSPIGLTMTWASRRERRRDLANVGDIGHRTHYAEELSEEAIQVLVTKGWWDKALSATELALQADPNNASLWVAWSRCCLETEHRHLAKHGVDRALQSNPRNADALSLLAFLRYTWWDYEGSIKASEAGLTVDPFHRGLLGENHRTKTTMARLRRPWVRPDQPERRDRRSDADRLDAMIAVDPDNADLLLQRSDVALRDGSIEHGAQLLQAAVKSDPRIAGARTQAVLARHRKVRQVLPEEFIAASRQAHVDEARAVNRKAKANYTIFTDRSSSSVKVAVFSLVVLAVALPFARSVFFDSSSDRFESPQDGCLVLVDAEGERLICQ